MRRRAQAALICGLLASGGCVSAAGRVVAQAETIPWWRWDSLTLDTETLHAELAFLIARTATLGFHLRWEPLPAQYRGRSNAELHVVSLNATLRVDDAVYTLAHEVAHLLQPPHLTEPEAEVFAEVVAFEVLRGFGRDARDITAHYLAYWKSGLPAARLYRVEIADAVQRMLVGWAR